MKFTAVVAYTCLTESLPTRERGLKYAALYRGVLFVQSLPTRERGLKLAITCFASHHIQVAPYAGAWIEIILSITIMSSD